ncbi:MULTISPECIES: LysM peptidoglycan-binding domain-containing protein [Silvimonas]|uniref:LysM peptidoglycan-binding domain-containing protein n=1 Tax=Silvimonas TaxID=300264 RepID=UPI0024B32C22|nr:MULTISPECIES: LysM peptidoglycan-binding domain-containing protein [Silvimonas]MDR3427216.1 LysM peptidoglycan-binding domain-containing protein [Silvimonas sp.]
MKYRLLAGIIASLLSAATFADSTTPVGSARLDYQLHDPAFQITDDTRQTVSILFDDAVVQAIQYDSLWDRVRGGFAMQDTDPALVTKWENYYAARPEYLNRIMDRGQRYMYYVAGEVEKRGMPMELALLPMIESAYNPKAESPARAAGMWQFIPDTGKRYGLERTWWYDGRRDVVAATQAALDYLEELHGMFGDWQLALASYNWGENAVARAVAKNQAAGMPTDYASLRMPDETRNYVPKLLAIRNIIANPQAYGIQLTDIPNRPYFATVSPDRHMDVKVAAELAETPVQELLRLNPGFIRPVIAHKDDRQLVLPADKVDVFQKNLASYDKPLLNWQPYVTHQGENFDKLAASFGIPAGELKDVNDINTRERVARGQTILVPKSADVDGAEQQTLLALAANRAADPLDTGANDKPQVRRVSAVASPRQIATDDSNVVSYRVARGDTVFNIAKRYGITVASLKSMNGLRSNHISQGQTLKLASNTGGIKRISYSPPEAQKYVVKQGDTVSSIARRHNVDTADLKRWNPQQSFTPGVHLVIYQPNS